MIRTEFMKLYEELSELNEAKADTQKLVDFAGEDLANRFLAIKNRLKAPENDLYYWVNHRTVADLRQAVTAIETAKSNTQARKEGELGAKLIVETEHWKVYHITSFEASQKYGRDTKWCITGADDSGDRYWREYTEQGVIFYFFIAKDNYNPRGWDSKFALVLYPKWNEYEVYDQQDNPVDSLADIPNLTKEELVNPIVNFATFKPMEVYDGLLPDVCEICGQITPQAHLHFTDEDDGPFCDDCWATHSK